MRFMSILRDYYLGDVRDYYLADALSKTKLGNCSMKLKLK
jgi:hypothetical protein